MDLQILTILNFIICQNLDSVFNNSTHIHTYIELHQTLLPFITCAGDPFLLHDLYNSTPNPYDLTFVYAVKLHLPFTCVTPTDLAQMHLEGINPLEAARTLLDLQSTKMTNERYIIDDFESDMPNLCFADTKRFPINKKISFEDLIASTTSSKESLPQLTPEEQTEERASDSGTSTESSPTETLLEAVAAPTTPIEEFLPQLTPEEQTEERASDSVTSTDEDFYSYYSPYQANRLSVELERIHRARPDLSKEKIFSLMTDDLDDESIKFALWLHDHDSLTTKSNLFYHKGKAIDVTKLSHPQIYGYLITIDETRELMKLEHVRSLFQASTPTLKLYYPTPFIAAPSFMHDDIFFIHILQYQFWLWFVFIFLIIFFFVSFVCTVRWCALRSQPRRETRGVSRSKCGDLITALVPVTWAISIIVSESTDASDTFDGFSTNDVMVGIRAYQWGWEYYYPKAVNLQYNLKPNYSAFIGNSLKYTTTSDVSLTSNNLWKQYQNRPTDKVITPAHLLVLPIDNDKMFNFMNFNDIGARTAINSSAFTKIRSASKTFNTNLVHTPSTFLDKYKQINNLLDNENRFIDSSVYGLKRQHNLTPWMATTANSSNFLDREGMSSFLNHSAKVALEARSTENFTHNNQYGKLYGDKVSQPSYQIQPTISNNTSRYDVLLHTQTELTTSSQKTKELQTPKLETQLQTHVDFSNQLSPLSISAFETSSDDESILGSEQSNRHMVELNHATKKKLKNHAKGGSVTNHINTMTCVDTDEGYGLKKNQVSADNIQKSLNRSGYSQTVYPIMSNNPKVTPLNYDNPTAQMVSKKPFNGGFMTEKSTKTGEVIHLLQGRRDGLLPGISSSYWQMFWANSSSNLRISSVLQSNFNTDSSYLPLFDNYYEYDFRNAQALELLEEAYWENSYSSYNHLDYLNIREAFKKTPYSEPYISRMDVLYYDENTDEVAPEEDLLTPGIKDLSTLGQFYANIVQSDEPFTPANLSLTKDFGVYPILESVLNVDESFVNLKEHNLLINQNNNTPLTISSDSLYPQSYVSVLDNFRADFDDFSSHSELSEGKSLKDAGITTELVTADLIDATPESVLTNNTNRFANPVTLRKTAKNSIVTYNAIQKVFRTRLDEGRSNIKISHFSDLYNKQAFLNEARVPYEKLLGKNRTSYYNNTFYNSSAAKSFNQFTTLNNSLNTWFYDFPFLLGMVSDNTRHFWFDWYAQWGMIEVQPSSLSKFSTLGVPYARKNYDFSLTDGDVINASDRYLNRISRARKNYLPNWLFTPYLYSRSQIWNKTNLNTILMHTNATHTGHTRSLLTHMHWYWTDHFFMNQNRQQFTPSISGNNMYNRATWRPTSSIQSYYYHNTLLVDLLTKREFIYRQYFETNRKVIALPKLLTANPQHPLVRELKSSFLFIDPTTYNSEYSREVYYNSLDYFKFMLLKGWLLQLDQRITNAPINTTLINEYFFYYFFLPQKAEKVGHTQDLYKSQFRPLKKGITSMLRLQGTGAVAMPIEIRLQILASSRDVIHSWSVPSAGVKIDCIPGYTSHRVMTFLTPGIYWGQCQEICGRYHHWMPIVVYFMKRDLFFLWCTHFVFRNPVNGTSSNSDKQFNDYIRFASYDKASWLSEVSKL